MDSIATDIQPMIRIIRGKPVMIDRDLAHLYDVQVRALNQAVKRNKDRFPEDFMFQLTTEEEMALRSQNVILKKRGQHAKYLPYAFTEQGTAMLSSVLRSKEAIQANILIMRAFVRLRHMILDSDALRYAIQGLEKRLTRNERDVQLAMRYLQQILFPPARKIEKPKRKMGFHPKD